MSHSLHLFLCRWCSQKPRPPQSVHRCLCRLCSQSRCCRSLCTCSSASGVRRGCCSRSLCTGASAAGVRRGRCHRSLGTGSSVASARRGRCRRSLCTCSSAAGVRRARVRAAWLWKDVSAELCQCLLRLLGSHHALRASGTFLVALRAPLPFSSCPLRQFLCR